MKNNLYVGSGNKNIDKKMTALPIGNAVVVYRGVLE